MTVLFPLQRVQMDVGALYVNRNWHKFLWTFDDHTISTCYIDSVSTQLITWKGRQCYTKKDAKAWHRRASQQKQKPLQSAQLCVTQPPLIDQAPDTIAETRVDPTRQDAQQHHNPARTWVKGVYVVQLDSCKCVITGAYPSEQAPQPTWRKSLSSSIVDA